MKPSVYLETTIPSYLTAWPSRDRGRATDQAVTHQWWSVRDQFDLFVSQLVLDECRQGDATAAADRLAALQEIAVLAESPDALELASRLVRDVRLPAKATSDAIHVAIAAIAGIEYFLTWTCRHIANPVFGPRIESVCRQAGYLAPRIVTPTDLLKRESFG